MKIRPTPLLLGACLGLVTACPAHDAGTPHTDAVADPFAPVSLAALVPPPGNAALMSASFTPFKPNVRHYWDASYFYAESDSMPDATLMPNIMVGITTWQQQLPITAGYFGNITNQENDPVSLGYGQPNIWRIPLVPTPAASPISLTGNFLRGAVALAANGIAIFNPRNNTGQFSQAIGELDSYGGHCGRADDYHYHIAPTHLYSVLTPDKPCAWALDGYPIYGYVEPDGSAQQALDTDGGHNHGSWGYHYHARGTAATGPQSPHLMSAMHGQVVNYGGQIDPQPTVGGIAPAGAPLAGAAITAFARPARDSCVLTYTLAGTAYNVSWTINRIAHSVAVTTQSTSGTTSATYTSAARFNYYPMAPASMARLPDTGQALSATSTPGEDSDYTVNPPSYTDNGNGTITDNVTGLMWQKTDSGEMTWDAAISGATALALGGFTDWRLPTAQEAFSILNHNTNPALNSTYFVNNAGGTPGYWWTSDLFYGDNTKVWATNSGGGLGPHPKTSTLSAGGASRFHARYVRGARPTVGHNYTNNNDGTITDTDTGLMWTQAPSSALSWTAALTYAEGLSLAGFTDWRLPNVKELQSLEDIPRATASAATTAPCMNRILFPAVTAAGHWSSTSVKSGTPTEAWVVDFGVTSSATPSRNQQGIVSYSPYATTYPVLAVRTAGAAPTQQIAIEQESTTLSDGASTVAWGTVAVGPPVAKTFTIRNNGNTSLTVGSITIDGTGAASFSLATSPASSAAAGGTTTFSVLFSPAAVGAKTAALHIASSDASVGAAFDIALTGTGTAAPPAITGTSTNPNTPTYVDSVFVTAQIQAAPGTTLTNATLNYTIGGAQTTAPVFTETMAATAVTPWTGTGANNPWTVTSLSGTNTIKQVTAANHGAGNACGLQFDKGDATLTNSMVATASSINATGTAGCVEFWVNTASMISPNGWTFQLSPDGGTTWTTRLSELTGSNHVFQSYHYDLLPAERVSTLRMRFQFAGYPAVAPTPAPKCNIDDITVATTTGSPPVPVTMLDDGLHGDGLAGDGIFGGTIPVRPAGTVVNYTLTATDNNGGFTSTTAATYTVSAVTPATNFLATASLSGNTVTLLWPAQPGISYAAQWSDDLIHWTSVPVGQTGTWSDTGIPGTVRKRFYRVMR